MKGNGSRGSNRISRTRTGFSRFSPIGAVSPLVFHNAGWIRSFGTHSRGPSKKDLSKQKADLINEIMWVKGSFDRKDLSRLSVGSLSIIKDAVVKAESVVNRDK